MSDAEPAAKAKPANGGTLLVASLLAQGVDRVFCVPGESYLPVLDALFDAPEIAVVTARHEGAAANMAEADGKLTGRPGICMVTRGPGATHACVGVHTAMQDSTPMILFIGQVASDARDREGFQEIDYRAMFAPLAKWAAEIDDAQRIPEYVARAYRVAMQGRMGPVVLSLPEDMLSGAIGMRPVSPRIEPAQSAPRPQDLRALAARLAVAERPLLVLGGTGWTDASLAALVGFAERGGIPVVSSFRRQGLIDNEHPNYCGHMGLGIDPRLARRVAESDLILAVGTRLGENTSGGYELIAPPLAHQPIVHVHPDPNEVGHVFQPELGIACSLAGFGDALAGLAVEGAGPRRAWLEAARADYVDFSTAPAPRSDYVDLGTVVGWLSTRVAPGTIIANGAGNYCAWVHRYFRYRHPHTELAPTSGAMGYGVPAAIAAALRHPDRQVIAFAGDGCFLMYPQELGTAVQNGAKLVILIANNGTYGTIRMHQEHRFPGRVIATDIVSPDFAALARSFGAFGERVETTADFAPAFERALACGGPAVLDLRTDPLQIAPTIRIPAR
jgi:acetolactate synthase-1/2/3 large subunit